jgi:adenosylcobyric acid synthase
MIKGFLVNRFRGDPTLFDDGMRIIAEKTGWQNCGLIPHFPDAFRLPAEDAVALDRRRASRDAPTTIAVLQLPRISNFDDFDPLAAEPNVRLVMVKRGEPIPREADLVILPGSKATIADLQALRDNGWEIDLKAHHRYGGKILGVCGGYQMLGQFIDDPNGIEGPAGGVNGLGLLDVTTVMEPKKTLISISGVSVGDDVPFKGYEMHIGVTSGSDTARPVLRFSTGTRDGATSADGLVRGVYVHGLFADDQQRAKWLAWVGASSSGRSYEQGVDATLDALAAHLEKYADLETLFQLAR